MAEGIEFGEVRGIKEKEVTVGEHPYFLIELKDVEADDGTLMTVNASITTNGIFNANDDGDREYQLRGLLYQLLDGGI